MPSILQSDIQPHEAAAKLLALVHKTTRVEDIRWYHELAEQWHRVADGTDEIGALKFETEIALEYAQRRIISKTA